MSERLLGLFWEWVSSRFLLEFLFIFLLDFDLGFLLECQDWVEWVSSRFLLEFFIDLFFYWTLPLPLRIG